jgi:hypothetical protein
MQPITQMHSGTVTGSGGSRRYLLLANYASDLLVVAVV